MNCFILAQLNIPHFFRNGVSNALDIFWFEEKTTDCVEKLYVSSS